MATRRRGSDARDRLTQLRDAYLFGGVPEDMRPADLDRLLRFVGLSPAWSKRASVIATGIWRGLPGARTPNDLRHAINRTLGLLAFDLPGPLLQQAADDEHGPRPLPPVRQNDPVRIGDHGTIRCGQIDRDRDGRALRPHICIWLERGDDAPCEEYAWFQFVHPSIWIGPPGGPLRDRTKQVDNRTLEARTGLNVTLCRWNPDYQADEIEAEEDRTGRKLPTFEPPGRELRQAPPGKPYLSRPIPNEDGQVGLVDAPDWCTRGRGKRGQELPAPIELMWRRTGNRDCVEHVGPPPDGQERVEIRMEFRSYLVCLDDMRCVGFQNWQAVNAATINYGWQEDRTRPPEGGITGPSRPRFWCTTSRIDNITYSIRIANWVAC